ncbi:MAG: hypothetical protein OXH12_03990, partial [Chloroflexi bacterium]|nr:hypothetical protein [Chloroflexota bacterium]
DCGENTGAVFAPSLSAMVVFHDEDLAGTYDSFEEAAEDAIERFGTGPYLIREVGASRIVSLPESVRSYPV